MRIVQTVAGMAMVGMIVFALDALRDILMPRTLAALLSFALTAVMGDIDLNAFGEAPTLAVPA